MRRRNFIRQAVLALGVLLLLGSKAPPAEAQANCLTFGQARKAGLFAQFNLRPAGVVKNEVEARTGGRVVAFLICRPGPVYKLTVLRPDGNVVTVTVPAQ